MTTHRRGPRTQVSDVLHAMKYRSPGEDFREAMNRVAFRLADDGDHYHEFREVLLDQRFLPGGRVQGAIGASRKVTPFNCYVSRSIDDSFVEGEGSIMMAALEAAATMRMGGGIGYDFSTLRPRGDAIVKLASSSSGPVNFMTIFDAVCRCVASSGHRRGAQMGVMRIDHPDVEEFIKAKQSLPAQDAIRRATEDLPEARRREVEIALQAFNALTGFNVSVAVTDEFMEALARKSTFALKFGGRAYREVDAEELWEKVMRSTWDFAEPGVLFVDRINEMNNLWYAETIAATNPCVVGETLIAVAGRGAVPISVLARQAKDVPVFAVNPKTGEMVVRMGRNPRRTKHRVAVVKVTFDDGSSMRCTPDHRFPLRDGRKVKAENLAVGDSLFRFDSVTTKQDGVAIGLGDRRRLEYHLIAEAKYGMRFDFGREVGQYNVHHADENHFNNVWDNIEVEEVGDHSSLHKSGDVNPMRKWWASASEAERGRYRANMRAATSGDKNGMHGRKHKASTLSKIGAKTRERFGDPEFRARHLAGCEKAINHKVASVEPDGFADVYNITVDEFHNYAVVTSYGESPRWKNPTSSGVIVCNCGEQPLPPNGACLLGSFNLAAYLRPETTLLANGVKWNFDWDGVKLDVPTVVRAMDNIFEHALFPLPAQAAEARNKRRMGLGVTGLANAAEALGLPYGSHAFVAFEERVLRLIKDECYRASAAIAAKKGPFPLFDAEKYLAGKFIKTLPDDIRDAIAKTGIRNSHLTSIAPTGTISMCADNVSSSIEPVFAYSTTRPINTPDGPVVMTIEDYGAGFLGVRGKLAADVTAQEHVDVLVAAARQVDSAVSKTCNVPEDMPWEDFKGIYRAAFEGGAKGCTTFNAGGKRMALLTPTKSEPKKDEAVVLDGQTCEVDPATGRRNCE